MRVVLRCCSLIAVAAVCASAASAAGPPGGRIVFSSTSGGNGSTRIWTVRADGSGRHAVSPAGVEALSPALSRDGRLIALSRRGDIYVMNVNGSGMRRLTFSASTESSPAWSADGRWIAYSSYESGRSSIWKMRANGGGKTRLAVGSLDVPAWSPDSARIAYAGVNGQIWVMNANGTGKHALTTTRKAAGVDWAPSWSPDGRRIAYESDVGTGGGRKLTNEIHVIGADGTHPVRLTHNALNDNHPVWSPHGAWLLFSSERPHSGPSHLWLVRPNGRGLHRITAWAGEQYWPSWA
jgi:TolB protein